MYVMQIVKVVLTDAAKTELSYSKYLEVSKWLETWTPQSNYKAVIGRTEEECLRDLREDLGDIVPSWMMGVGPGHFRFCVSVQDIGETRRFWMPAGTMMAKWHSV